MELSGLPYTSGPTSALLLGMQCLLRAFAPELAGQTLEQASANAAVY